jgi:succinate-semialdehyde dehydrogenase/glutarate-semialdehyde dehydrogenase
MNAAKRQVYEAFERRIVAGLAQLKVGGPMDSHTDVGPRATAQSLETIERQVQTSVKAGATLLTGGEPLDRPGNSYRVSALVAHSRATTCLSGRSVRSG